MCKLKYLLCITAILAFFYGCNGNKGNSKVEEDDTTMVKSGGQESVVDDESQKDVVKVAVSSPDHTTLVAALKHVEYVDDLSNAGPFTVFAPTNAAFDKLPKGTLDDLLKEENKAVLKNILEYHVAVGGYKTEYMQDGQNIGMANGDNIKISMLGDKVVLNETINIIATIPASNGIIYVVDGVLLPPSTK